MTIADRHASLDAWLQQAHDLLLEVNAPSVADPAAGPSAGVAGRIRNAFARLGLDEAFLTDWLHPTDLGIEFRALTRREAERLARAFERPSATESTVTS